MTPFDNTNDVRDFREIKAHTEILDRMQVILFDPSAKSNAEPKVNKRIQRVALSLFNYGQIITKAVRFAETATGTSHVATIPIPAGAILHGIRVIPEVLWGAGAAVLKVGDTADDDGYFTGVNLKATDALVGEVLDTTHSTLWGGKEGAYLVAATGRRGPTTGNFGSYYAAGSNIVATITVTTPAVTTGRTVLVASYSLGTTITPVVS